jgi:hypothetical protein
VRQRSREAWHKPFAERKASLRKVLKRAKGGITSTIARAGPLATIVISRTAKALGAELIKQVEKIARCRREPDLLAYQRRQCVGARALR